MKSQTKIIVLWSLILFKLVFHSLIELIPLFSETSILMPETTSKIVESMPWISLIIYLIPMIYNK